MRVAIAGAHGKIALRLTRLLVSRGDTVIGMIRNPDQVADVEAAGAMAVVCDLERATVGEVAELVIGADAAVFAAGAGPGSGLARKDTVDRAAAVLFAEAARTTGARRHLLVSSTGVDAEPPPGTDEVFAAYLRAKKAAEVAVSALDLDTTVLRPGPLTDELGSGLVRLAPPPVGRGSVSRDNVAAVLVALLDAPRTAGMTLELFDGDVPIADAIDQL